MIKKVSIPCICALTLLLLVTPTIVMAHETNELTFPKSMFPQSSAYKAGWAAGFLGQPFKGNHTQDYIIGYLNGTSTYELNRSEAPGHTMDFYIGFRNGAGAADDDYAKGSLGYHGCHDGHGKEYCKAMRLDMRRNLKYLDDRMGEMTTAKRCLIYDHDKKNDKDCSDYCGSSRETSEI